MNICSRIAAFLLTFAFCVVALGEDERPKPVYGIPKKVYDLIVHFDTLGIDKADVETDNLGFESQDLEECIEKVPTVYAEKDELAIAYTACVKRHPVTYTVIT